MPSCLVEKRMRVCVLVGPLSIDPDLDKNLIKSSLASSSPRMYVFAELTGFDGSRSDWDEVFKDLCSESNCEPQDGVDFSSLRQLVDDKSDTRPNHWWSAEGVCFNIL